MTMWKCVRWWWIVALLPLLAGCSAMRLAYNQGPELLYWWADGYLDFEGEQSPRVRAALHDWFAWHRATQLPEYANLLQRARAEVLLDATPGQACRWLALGTEKVQQSFEQAVPGLAPLVLLLRPTQLRHLEAKFRKQDEEFRHAFLQPVAAERQEAALKRAIDRAESLYGTLDEAQRRRVDASLAESPFDPELWLAERQARQADIVRQLQALAAERAGAARVEAALRALSAQAAQSPRPAYRAYQARYRDFSCSFLAQVHNATSAAQRRHAADKFKGWEEDVRALAAQRQVRAPMADREAP